MTIRLLAGVLGALVVLVAGCGVVAIRDGSEDMQTLSEQQALQRVEEHIARAVAALPVAPRLEKQSAVGAVPCDDPSDLGPLGRVSVSDTYWMRGLDFDRPQELFAVMHDHWLAHDYRVLADHRDDHVAPALFVEHNGDAFRMSMATSVQGDFSISATSPCVWPDGTPPPEVEPR
ncbi:MAG: hypothetical protein ACRDT0_12740 [Pseudonocardiaceae bacterium]